MATLRAFQSTERATLCVKTSEAEDPQSYKSDASLLLSSLFVVVVVVLVVALRFYARTVKLRREISPLLKTDCRCEHTFKSILCFVLAVLHTYFVLLFLFLKRNEKWLIEVMRDGTASGQICAAAKHHRHIQSFM